MPAVRRKNNKIDVSRVEKLLRDGNRGSRVEQAHLDWLTENMDEFAGRPVQWLTTQLNEHFQIQPPLAKRTVDKAINKLTAYTLKLMRVEPERYNDPERIEGRRQWAENVLHAHISTLPNLFSAVSRPMSVRKLLRLRLLLAMLRMA